MLTQHLLLAMRHVSAGNMLVLQQDSAPVHRARETVISDSQHIQFHRSRDRAISLLTISSGLYGAACQCLPN